MDHPIPDPEPERDGGSAHGSDVEAARLSTLADYGLIDTPPNPRFDAIVREAAERLGTTMATITLVERDRQWFKARVGVEAGETPIAESICAHVIRHPESLVVENAADDDRFSAMAAVAGAPGIRFYAGTPLTLRTGVRVGTLCVYDAAVRHDFDDADRMQLEQLASRAVAEFELERDLRLEERREPFSEAQWIALAQSLLGRACAALERCEATRALAQLDQVMAEVGQIAETEPL